MRKRMIGMIVILAAALAVAKVPEAVPQSATVPMTLDHNRMTVMLEMLRPDGAWKSARAWVDTGGTEVLIAEALARELGMDLSALPAGGGQTVATKVPVPALRLGGVLLAVEGMALSVRTGRFALPGIMAECVLPPRCLRRLHAVFDYPARELTVARPGVLTPHGAAVPCRVNPETGLFMVEATIDGEKAALGVDTGSAGTWVSDKLTAAWLARHPDWPQALGAAGSTNFFGFPFETKGVLLSLPALAIGSLAVDREVAVLGLDQRIFDWYSQKSAAPVSGFLGAELIARYRLEIDFPAQRTWWLAGPPPAARDLDMVGLCLRPEADGSYIVAGVVSRDGRVLVTGVEPGDRLLKVDGLEVAAAPMGRVIDALRGKPGDERLLLLEREGQPLAIRAAVAHLPWAPAAAAPKK